MSPEDPALPLPAERRPLRRLEFALPTINIIFILILYFIFAGTIAQRGELSVAPPVSREAADSLLQRPLLLIGNDGTLRLDGTMVTEADLLPAAQAATSGGATLHLLVPASMSAAPLLRYVARFSEANVPVRLVTVREDSVAP